MFVLFRNGVDKKIVIKKNTITVKYSDMTIKTKPIVCKSLFKITNKI